MANILQRNAKGWTLYCVAYDFSFKSWVTGKVKSTFDFEYLYAENRTHAKLQFFAGNADKARSGKLEIVECAPVVGWHALDDNGDKAVA